MIATNGADVKGRVIFREEAGRQKPVSNETLIFHRHESNFLLKNATQPYTYPCSAQMALSLPFSLANGTGCAG